MPSKIYYQGNKDACFYKCSVTIIKKIKKR